MVRAHGLSAHLIVRAAAFSAALLVVSSPMPAEAHAAFVSSEPEPGAELSSAPGIVVLRFSEPLVRDLSSVAVILPGDERIEGRVSGDRRMEARLTTNAPGVYRVEWATVSPLDGHTLRGEFRFGVGIDPGPDAEGGSAVAPGPTDLALAAGRTLEYVALLLALGMVLIRHLGRRSPELEWARPPLSRATGAARGAGLVVIFGEALIAAGGVAVGPVVVYLT
ncbi:MAG: copper resistance protein CopC, partial [Actinomycetota bacterium]|nr:copper resistance protein CopC [Actinomycetota bacterium]